MDSMFIDLNAFELEYLKELGVEYTFTNAEMWIACMESGSDAIVGGVIAGVLYSFRLKSQTSNASFYILMEICAMSYSIHRQPRIYNAAWKKAGKAHPTKAIRTPKCGVGQEIELPDVIGPDHHKTF